MGNRSKDPFGAIAGGAIGGQPQQPKPAPKQPEQSTLKNNIGAIAGAALGGQPQPAPQPAPPQRAPQPAPPQRAPQPIRQPQPPAYESGTIDDPRMPRLPQPPQRSPQPALPLPPQDRLGYTVGRPVPMPAPSIQDRLSRFGDMVGGPVKQPDGLARGKNPYKRPQEAQEDKLTPIQNMFGTIPDKRLGGLSRGKRPYSRPDRQLDRSQILGNFLSRYRGK